MQACTGTILVKCERGNKTLESFNTLTSPLSDSPEDYSVTVTSKAGYCCAVSGTGRFGSGLYFLSEFFRFCCDDLTSSHSLFSRFLTILFSAFASRCFVCLFGRASGLFCLFMKSRFRVLSSSFHTAALS